MANPKMMANAQESGGCTIRSIGYSRHHKEVAVITYFIGVYRQNPMPTRPHAGNEDIVEPCAHVEFRSDWLTKPASLEDSFIC